MKVILLQKSKMGDIGDVVTVAPGYGRNWLLPQNIAKRATKDNIADLEKIKKDLQKKQEEMIAQAQENAKKIDNNIFNIYRQSGDDGRLYGSVSTKDIADSVTTSGIEISRNNINIFDPIKEIGISEVSISLAPSVDVNVLINVARTESEAEEAALAYKESLKNTKKKAESNDTSKIEDESSEPEETNSKETEVEEK